MMRLVEERFPCYRLESVYVAEIKVEMPVSREQVSLGESQAMKHQTLAPAIGSSRETRREKAELEK